jgi:hypothetical protein
MTSGLLLAGDTARLMHEPDHGVAVERDQGGKIRTLLAGAVSVVWRVCRAVAPHSRLCRPRVSRRQQKTLIRTNAPLVRSAKD